MSTLDMITMAFSNLWRRKLRTSLTILAIVIGATLIALMVSLGNGLERFIVDQFGISVSQQSITITKQEFRGFDNNHPQEINLQEAVQSKPFTKEEVDQIKAISGVESVSPAITLSTLYISPEGSSKKYTILANTASDYEFELKEFAAGSAFSETDGGKCVISYDYMEAFGWASAEEAIGKNVSIAVGRLDPFDFEIKEYNFEIVGITQKSISATEVFVTKTDAIEMARFYQEKPELYSEEEPGFILQAKAASAEITAQVASDIEALGFYTITAEEILEEINNVFNIIQVVLSAFGVIALVVASIGIINTLIMSIYERTREIGIMKAVGARKRTIRLMFTIEGGALGFLGGAVGIAFAYILGQGLNIIGAQTFLSDFPNFNMSVFPAYLIFGVIGLTTAISLLAALYPANRASNLDPVEALRYE